MRVAEPRSRVPVIDERGILRDERFRDELRQLAVAQNRDARQVEQYARQCLEEMAVRPADRYLGWTAALARFIYSRSFANEFDVDRVALEKLKEMARNRPVIFLWSHTSHLDAFVLMRALYDANFRPQPLTFAGINMNFMGFGPLVRHSGAIFLRRSFHDDEIYKLVLRHFIDYLASRRVPLSWSIEGTRSRTGKLLPPKLGLIHWFVDAYRRASIEDAVFVPVAISFDQIPEMDDYIAMQHGLPKRKESLRWFIDYIAGMKPNYGKAHVRFAEPISLSESFSASEVVLGEEGQPGTQVQKLAFEVCNRIEHVVPISLTDLVTLVLLAANGRALDAGQVCRQALDIAGLIERGALPTIADLQIRNANELERELQLLADSGLLERYAQGAAPVYVISPGRQLAAAYYRNTIVHYFLSSAMAEVALAMAGRRVSEGSVRDAILGLRDLFKFEFFFKSKEAFAADAIDFLDFRYPGWRVCRDAFPPGPPPMFGPGILRSFTEAYSVLAQLLVSRGRKPVLTSDEQALIKGCLARGREMLLRKEISTETALSQPLFATALRLARYRGLLDSQDPAIRRRREQFAAEVQQALFAINRLQDNYDRQLHEPSTGQALAATALA